jgi:putative phosphoribosyl transferase
MFTAGMTALRSRHPGGVNLEAVVMTYRDRHEAGLLLTQRLEHLRGPSTVVLGLPRGGVPVAFEAASALGAPLDVIVVRKLGVPFQPELAMGAIGEDGVGVLNDDIVRRCHVTAEALAAAEQRERAEVAARAERFRAGRPRVPLQGKIAIIVDDGVATGATARAACQVARAQGAASVVLAVPVAPPGSIEDLREVADEVVCALVPPGFYAVGQWYEDFAQVPDRQVTALLHGAGELDPGTGPDPDDPPVRDEEVWIDAGPVELTGHLTLPEQFTGIVVFAHGSGSSRYSPRNRQVAEELHQAQLGTLLFDLLMPHEEQDRAHVFDIDLLAERLTAATRWLERQPEAAGQSIGYFGASTGAAAALRAAAEPDSPVAAVVSRGGRPDLALLHLGEVRAATLLLVGGADTQVLALNQRALERLHCERQLTVIPDATHLFEEPGALESVADLAASWLRSHLAGIHLK